MSNFRRFIAALFAVSALTAAAAPPASANPVDEVVCWVKTGNAVKCFHWGP